jgi:LacI family transcriptional regulator
MKTPRPPAKPPATGTADSPASSTPATLRDIATIAGVSMQTVSLVVNNSGSISQAVRDRVQEVARSVGYIPNKSAKAMRTGRSQTLGLIIDDLGHPYWAEYAQEAERAAAAQQYAVLLIDAHDASAEPRIDALRTHPVDGIITAVYTPAVARLDLPMVVISSAVTRGRDSVTSNNLAGGSMVIDHLLALGHRKFALVTSQRTVGVPDRRKGYLDRIPPTAKVLWELHTSIDEAIPDEFASLVAKARPTAIVCWNDTIAIGVLKALHKLKIDVPGEISVIGYDDISWAKVVTPALTTVRQPFDVAAQRVMELLTSRMADPTRRARQIMIDVVLVERDSTGPAPGRK